MVIEDGELVFKDLTQPYGFVDLGAKVWFQEFSDDGVVHKYLMTEGYIWNGRYPEAQRILDKGNNQSMELDQKSLQGNWSKSENGDYEFFIINEAVISALCILGEDVEPCFEGASVTKVQFSLEDDFKTKMFSMINEIKEILSKGGEPVDENKVVDENIVEVESSIEETEVTEFTEAEVTEEIEEVTEVAEETNEEVEEEEEKVEEAETEVSVEEVEAEVSVEEEVPTYSLEEISEYVELRDQYSDLQSRYSALEEEVKSLREYKSSIEKSEKQAMIDKFYMLSDEDKADVVANIDTYSVDEIEAKLCVACFRKGISFGEETKDDEEVTTFNLIQQSASTTPAWIQAVEKHSKR